MRFTSKSAGLLVLLIGAFLAGYLVRPQSAGVQATGAGVHRPVYYHDPMHPAYRSDKPGIAPDCGMQLEPVYADSVQSEGSGGAIAPGAVRISFARQQLMGLKTARITRCGGSHTIRVLGKVAADETRTYRVAAFGEGAVRQVSSYTVGSVVRKDDLLATYFVYLRDIYAALQQYFIAQNSAEQAAAVNSNSAIMDSAKAQVRLQEELLHTYGMTEAQLRQLAYTRQLTRDIEFRSPVNGVILARNAAIGQRVERGTELFRIADLTRIWILADLFENEAGLVRRGSKARVTYRGQTYKTGVANPIWQFDADSRTVKLRLDVDNPNGQLRPDMFVDVEFDVDEPVGLAVPVDSVLDVGRSKVVFVSTGEGVFEPRRITTGARFGDHVQVTGGIDDGTTIVTSGLFLLDSESRLQLAAERATAPPSSPPGAPSATHDPVCGMAVDVSKAANKSIHAGKSYIFCSSACKAKFDKNPGAYAGRTDSSPAGSQ